MMRKGVFERGEWFMKDKYVTGDCFKPLSHPFNNSSQKMIDLWSKLKKPLILWDYCQKHNIPVSRKDFYKGE